MKLKKSAFPISFCILNGESWQVFRDSFERFVTVTPCTLPTYTNYRALALEGGLNYILGSGHNSNCYVALSDGTMLVIPPGEKDAARILTNLVEMIEKFESEE